MATPDRDREGAFTSYLGDGWRIAGLWVLVAGEPVFSALRAHPEVLMARPGDPAAAALVLAGCVALLAPALLCGLLLACRAAGRATYRGAYRLLLGLLAAALVMQLVVAVAPDRAWVAAALAAGAGAAVLRFARRPALRTMANVVGLALIASPAWFLASPRVADLWRGVEAGEAAVVLPGEPPPVVFVLFDEFQLAALLDADGRINASLFPNLAAFAGEATWYRNARSVSAGTISAVPAALTGRMPTGKDASPTAFNHPVNLFTVLGGAMPVHAVETLTRLCPPARCPTGEVSLTGMAAGLLSDAAAIQLHRQLPRPWAGWLPEIDNAWGGFWAPGTALFPGGWIETAHQALVTDRGAQFERWVRGIRPGPGLHFIHAPLPHVPLVHYPDGRRYPQAGLYQATSQSEVTDPWMVTRAYQRYLLQTRYVDRLVGALVDRLKAAGVYREALVVVAADHGVYYGPGLDRRAVAPASADDVLRVPLWIKYPGQATGGVDDRLAYTIDILPTLLEALGADAPKGADGRSLRGAPRRDPLPAANTDGELQAPPLGRGLAGAFEPVGGIPRLGRAREPAALYRLGPHGPLVGRAVEEFTVAGEAVPDDPVWLRDEAALFDAPYDSDEVPGFILGVYRPDGGERFHAALALDRRIAAVTRSYFTPEGEHRFRFLVPPSVFDEPVGRVRVFRVEAGDAGTPRLETLYDRDRPKPGR